LVPAAQAFAAGPPTVTGLSTHEGPAAGGNTVTITGTEFTGATEVRFGSDKAASFTVVSSTEINAIPAAQETYGDYVVFVVTPEGASANEPKAAAYFFRPPPGNGSLTVEVEGSGSGEVTTFTSSEYVDGESGSYASFAQRFSGEPPIACAYNGSTASGTCTNQLANVGAEVELVRAIPSPGSEFVEWSVVEGVAATEIGEEGWCELGSEPISEKEEGAGGRACWFLNEAALGGSGENVVIKAKFAPAAPAGPALTIAKTGEGTVASSPAGITCTGAKTGAECEHAFTLNSTVTLTASPANGYAFSAWAGCTTHVGLTCTVEMSKAKTVKVTFVKTPSLTIEKAGSGQGKVGAPGISCDENCSSATAAVKAGTSVTVKVTPAKGSEAAVFENGTGSASSGCSGGTCTFTISENSSVTVKFNAIPTHALTVNLTGPAAYKGKVTGKGTVKGLTGAAINCGSGCTTQTESFFATDTVTLTAAAGTGYTFAGWSGGGCSGTGTCSVATSSDQTVEAEFK
jgi:hypothetical protein